MASTIRTIGTWLADHSLDELIENTSSRDIAAESSRPEILSFIEKKDKTDSERMMWGLLHTYNEIFMDARALLYFKRISGIILMGGDVQNHGGFQNYRFLPNLHKFWEMIVGKKIFSSPLKMSSPAEVHPEVRALLRTQMILLLEYVGLKRDEAVEMIQAYWREELKLEEYYSFGRYWETGCYVLHPHKLPCDGSGKYGRIRDAADDKWYAGVRRIYQEEIAGSPMSIDQDPVPRGLRSIFTEVPRDYEPATIDRDGPHMHAEESAQQLWRRLTSTNWPGWDEARIQWQTHFAIHP